MLKRLKKAVREYRIRIRLARHALAGTDFVRDAMPGHAIGRRYHSVELPDWTDTPEEESRAALLGRASEAETRYAAIRGLRERYETGEGGIEETVREMAILQGYDGDLHRAMRALEEEYRERAVSNIRARLEVEKQEWEDSGMADGYVLTDPRLKYRMHIRVTAREHARTGESEAYPPSVRYAIDDAPNTILSFLADGEENAEEAPTPI